LSRTGWPEKGPELGALRFGIHRCVGIRLTELQSKIVWQEILKRFGNIELAGWLRRVYSTLIKG
jgi:cytochrome P450